jgi:cysteine synthase A
MKPMTSRSAPLKSILENIGNTPLIELEPGIYAKCEYFNPSGSIKARMALYMVERAEKEGLLKPGDTIVESTSGNTGNALSMIAAVKGYKMIVVIPRGYSNERTQISRGFGAEVSFVGDFQVNEAREEAIRLGEQDGWWCPRQFDNEWNVEENREWLARKSSRSFPKNLKLDAIVQGVGTAGTLIGLAQGLRRDHNPDLKAFAMEPSESETLQCCIVCKHKIEGISDGFIPTIYERHRAEVTDVISVDSSIAIRRSKKHGADQGPFRRPVFRRQLLGRARDQKEAP